MALTAKQVRFLFAKGILRRKRGGGVKYSRNAAKVARSASRPARIAKGQAQLAKFLASPRGQVFGGPTATPRERRALQGIYTASRLTKRVGEMTPGKRAGSLKALQAKALETQAGTLGVRSPTYKARAKQIKKGIKQLRGRF